MKKAHIFSAIFAFMLALAMPAMAFADGKTFSITINDSQADHTYEAYQVFSGTLADDNKTLSDVAWGDGVTTGVSVLGNAAELAKGLKTAEDAEGFAKKVAPHLDKAHAKQGVSQGSTYKIDGLAPGYYLVKDADDSMTGKDGFYTAYVMKVVANTTATPKGDKPTIDKEIKNNQSNNWGKVADHQVGEDVEFRVVTSIPDKYDFTKYQEYKHTIHDTFSTGLTSKVVGADDVEIKVNDTTPLGAEYYTVEPVNSGTESFKVTIDVKKALTNKVVSAGDSLYTYYKATVNKNALIYKGENTQKQDNTVYLEYTNNPYGTETGKTVEKKVYDWSFQITLKKVNEQDQPLQGAKFVLSDQANLKVKDMMVGGVLTNKDGLIGLVQEGSAYRVATAEEKATAVYEIEAGTAEIKGLDGGKQYYLYETVAPNKYNALTAPVKVKIDPTYSTAGDLVQSVQTTVGDRPAQGLEVSVTNKAGTVFPETGGIGTTIFYVLGGLLVVSASVVLIAGRRMKNKNS